MCRQCASNGLAEPIPWERRKEKGTVRAFWETTKLASRSPTRFFRTPITDDRIGPPVLYGVLVYALGQLAYAAVIALALAGLSGFLALSEDMAIPSAIIAGYAVCVVFAMLFQVPLYALLGVGVAAAISHGVLALTKSANASFEDTLRAVCYSNAPYIWFFVPVIGPLMGWIWMVVVETIAIREVHGIGTDRAVLAVVVYRLLLLLVVMGMYGLMLALTVFRIGQ